LQDCYLAGPGLIPGQSMWNVFSAHSGNGTGFFPRCFSSPLVVQSPPVPQLHSSVLWRMDSGSITICRSLSQTSKMKDEQRKETENCLQNFVL
jgi:hypothetical protein